ncbi:MAG: ParB/RepB/Spo0J family partition protein [Oscillospiraceae bacterium]|nr:ParB/RepB/Spo0J family partition protein [Oscillospiraceae bacterium]
MAVKKGGLGRGLESLFQDTGSTAAAEGVTTLRIGEVEPDKNQPRKTFEESALQELASSIMEHGVLQPIVVRPAPQGGYFIIAGERRWRASRLAGLTEIPVIIKDVTNEEAMEIALIENLQREDLDPVEEALGYRQLMEKCNYTQEQAAAKLAKSRSSVANTLRILALPDKILAQLRQNMLTVGHGKVLLSLPNSDLQLQAAKIIISEGLNVRQTELLCKKLLKGEPKRKEMQRPPLPSEVELSLKEVLGTEIKVQYKEGKGSLQIAFYSDEQLKAFANLLGNYENSHTK